MQVMVVARVSKVSIQYFQVTSKKERMLAQFLASSCGRVMQTHANTLKAQLPKIARWGLPAAIGGKFLLSVIVV